MAPTRSSRFGGEEPRLEGPGSEDRITPDERLSRRLAGQVDWYDVTKTPDQKRAEQDHRNMAYNVRSDDEVSTDAVAVVHEGADERDPHAAGGWSVRWVLAKQEGRIVARSVHLEPLGRVTPPGGITANLLRELSPSTARSVAERGNYGDDDFSPLLSRWAEEEIANHGIVAEQPTPRGRPPLPDELLRDVAVAYLEEVGRGTGVLRRLAERFDRPETTLRDWVATSRKRGWLGPAERGRRGGAPGPRLIAHRRGDDSE